MRMLNSSPRFVHCLINALTGEVDFTVQVLRFCRTYFIKGSKVTDISASMTPQPTGLGLYFHRATASRTFLSISATPELRVIVALDTVPSSWIWYLMSGELLYDSLGRNLNGPFGKEPWTRIVFVHSAGTLFFCVS